MTQSTGLAARDVQASRPRTEVSLTRVGVRGIEKVIRVGGHRALADDGADGPGNYFFAELECFVDLNPRQAGVHMSRFEEVVGEAIDRVVLGESLRAEELAAHIAARIREQQQGLRAEVSIAPRYPETVRTPASDLPTQEIYTLLGTAVVSERGTRTLTGVEAQGMTACPCAQGLVSERARERLADDGFSDDEIERVFEHVPVATHNQRGLGTLYIGCPEACSEAIEAATLLAIVEESMSSEIYELMKRSDELEVVEKAHRRPRFVEDCVREMIRMAVEEFRGFGEDAFVFARQENLETIHQHNVVAEHFGLIGELDRELRSDKPSQTHMTMRDWLHRP